ncbi:MAG: class II glutamine amidotransferase [Candidatus Porifericomitaceae bacterium WSBS_2022_MAG_OTU9]
MKPQHNLYRQSWEPKEMRDAVVNADGYGIGWHQQQQAECYLSVHPIWNDVNLPTLARCIHSTSWAANVRSATPGQPVNEFNCQPFTAADWLFLHNGFIEDFHPGGREIMLRLLSPAEVAAMRGNADSSFICTLLLQKLLAGIEPVLALAEVASNIATAISGRKAILNLVLCRPGEIYALRHSISEHCASLYTCHDSAAFPGAHICASEAFDHNGWQPVPEHTLVKCILGKPAEYMPLAKMAS